MAAETPAPGTRRTRGRCPRCDMRLSDEAWDDGWMPVEPVFAECMGEPFCAGPVVDWRAGAAEQDLGLARIALEQVRTRLANCDEARTQAEQRAAVAEKQERDTLWKIALTHHSEHCVARQEWGDGECECKTSVTPGGAPDTSTAPRECCAAARRAALEEAAEIADRECSNEDNYKRGMNQEDMAATIAAAIRERAKEQGR